MLTVNELSCTMDLESTLVRAEVLFKKFRRLVEAIDKKENFPVPRKIGTAASSHTRENSSSSSIVNVPSIVTPGSSGTSTPSRPQPARSPRSGKAPAAASSPAQDEKKRIITPELRRLLSREVEVISRNK